MPVNDALFTVCGKFAAALVLRSLSDAPETCAQTVILYVMMRSPMTTSQPRHPAFLSLQGGINFRDWAASAPPTDAGYAAASCYAPVR